VAGGPYRNTYFPEQVAPDHALDSTAQFIDEYRNMPMLFCTQKFTDELLSAFPRDVDVVFLTWRPTPPKYHGRRFNYHCDCGLGISRILSRIFRVLSDEFSRLDDAKLALCRPVHLSRAASSGANRLVQPVDIGCLANSIVGSVWFARDWHKHMITRG
jgi:hypothetical protein